ncbi:vacuolar segregation protein pep7 [Podospora australis]|uniref:Vacuolar segregation protein pep7 n=1 Tax=Podospora australis TaxID=1536484 RepID=A0AAN7AN20_9PEZI|nr:vacuolar segregation protein pep7 [Podospora australis]
MATDFIMPRAAGQSQYPAFYPHQQPLRAQQQQPAQFHTTPITTPYPSNTNAQSDAQISPLSTSGNTSPTSPKNQLKRGIRPLYVPAALRPTEFPSKEPPQTPKPQDEDETKDEPLHHSSSFMSLGGLSVLGLSRRSTGDSKCTEGNWNLDLFPNPTGLPTRKHWKPDQDSAICDHATCKKSFNYFQRRHHCRRCGNIFCNEHSNFVVPLDQDANYNPRGVPSRACSHCFKQFKAWRSRTNSQSSSQDSFDSGNNVPDTPVTPTGTSPVFSAIPGRLMPGQPHTPEVAHSVPRDWHWSTF